MTTFYTPPGYSGQAELTAGNGLTVADQGLWRFSQAGYNDQASFGLSLTIPNPTSGGLLYLQAENWNIAVVGNTLTAYDTGTVIYPASQCRITVTGQWVVTRQQNSNSFNSQGVLYNGTTETNLGTRTMNPNLLSYSTWPLVTYVIQGVNVDGGAQDTFSTQFFEVKIQESASTKNSNKEFQSNTISRPVFAYTYTKSWQI